VLFALPETLKRCLDRGEYGRAVEAYCCCAEFLRQYQETPTFKKVLEEVEHQMNQIGSALEQRLRSPYLSVDEAVNSSVTLLDMGKDSSKVIREYLSGRKAVLRQSLEHCFCPEPLDLLSGRKEAASDDQKDLHTPESVALHSACWRLNDTYVPSLCDAVEGFQKLQEGRAPTEEEGLLPEFVSARLVEMFERLFGLIEQKRPPIRVLVSCMHSIRDAMIRLHSSLPELLTQLCLAAVGRFASSAMRSAFADAASSLVQELCKLHGECKRLQESGNSGQSENSGLNEVLEQIAKSEHALLMTAFTALTKCQPLVTMLGSDFSSCQQLLGELHDNLVRLFLVFCEASLRYIGRDPAELWSLDPVLAGLPKAAPPELEEVGGLDWSGVFGLALVRIGRHLEMKAIGKAWSIARELFIESVAGGAKLELVPPNLTIRAARGTAQVMISHYVLVSGQRLAYFFRNSIQNKNWMTVREPRAPSVIVETVILKEVHAFDAQLANILGDPRKSRPSERRPLNRFKDSMELEIERLVAKKLQIFAPIPFNRNGAIVGILRIAFKALYEYMREEMFAKFGVQQIQVDCAFLADAARIFVESEDAGALDSLLDEALTSASRRCEDPALIDVDGVERIVAARKQGQ